MPLFPNAPPFAKSAANAPGDRREGEAIVAYPSRMFPFEDRVVSRGADGCWRDFMSGIDFLTRSVLAPCEEADRYDEGARDKVWRGPGPCWPCHCVTTFALRRA